MRKSPATQAGFRRRYAKPSAERCGSKASSTGRSKAARPAGPARARSLRGQAPPSTSSPSRSRSSRPASRAGRYGPPDHELEGVQKPRSYRAYGDEVAVRYLAGEDASALGEDEPVVRRVESEIAQQGMSDERQRPGEQESAQPPTKEQLDCLRSHGTKASVQEARAEPLQAPGPHHHAPAAGAELPVRHRQLPLLHQRPGLRGLRHSFAEHQRVNIWPAFGCCGLAL